MNALNKLGIVLTVVFVVAVAALLLEVIYVLWRRRRFRRRSISGCGEVEFSGDSFYAAPSKELLYFFCWKNQTTRVEPQAASAASAPPLPATTTDVEVDDMLKCQGLYGPSRLLFTIREEEREDMETEDSSPAEKGLLNNSKKNENEKEKRGSVCLEEEVGVSAVVVDVEESTPFWTPCASPDNINPTPSSDGNNSLSWPGNQDGVVTVGQAEKNNRSQKTRGVCGDNTASFVSIEVHTSSSENKKVATIGKCPQPVSD